MAIIKNKNYKEFLDGGFIKFIEPDDIKQVVDNINSDNCKHPAEAKSLIIALYYSGARPSEILDMKGEDIYRKNKYVYFKIPRKKRGLSRLVLSKNTDLIKIMQEHTNKVHPKAPLFYHYIGKYKQHYKTKKGDIKEYIVTSYKLRYHFKKWFDGFLDISPYYLRHNRMSKLSAAGVTMNDLKQFKGSKTLSSIEPYLHLSTHTAKRIASKNT